MNYPTQRSTKTYPLPPFESLFQPSQYGRFLWLCSWILATASCFYIQNDLLPLVYLWAYRHYQNQPRPVKLAVTASGQIWYQQHLDRDVHVYHCAPSSYVLPHLIILHLSSDTHRHRVLIFRDSMALTSYRQLQVYLRWFTHDFDELQ